MFGDNMELLRKVISKISRIPYAFEENNFL